MNKFVYMDAAASYLKPQSVVESEVEFLTKKYANAGRGVCARVADVDSMIKSVRETVASFINADVENVVFTSGATDCFNRIVNILKATPNMFSENTICAGSDLDHHSLRGPFENAGVNFVVCPLDNELNIDSSALPFCDVLLITAMSNVLGVRQDIEKIIKSARKQNPNVITVVDAAQYVVHGDIDVKKWDCDFLCFSGHKIGADTGVGVMYIKNPGRFNVDKLGGGMVAKIVDKDWILEPVPYRFESGTLPITQIIGMRVAIQELKSHRPDLSLIEYMFDELSENKRIKMLSKHDSSILSFVIDDMHVFDFGTLVSAHDICLRVGNMCASWIHKYLGVDGSVRLSVGGWNTMDDAKYVVDVINGIVK